MFPVDQFCAIINPPQVRATIKCLFSLHIAVNEWNGKICRLTRMLHIQNRMINSRFSFHVIGQGALYSGYISPGISKFPRI